MENTEHSDPTLALLVSQGFSRTILERFWAKVQKTDGCWLWTGADNGFGHGKINSGGKNGPNRCAHVVSWLIHRGPIPDKLHVLHNCPGGDNPSCVNPDHLWLGTQSDNQKDMAKKGRAHRGYKLTDEQVLEIIRLRPTTTGNALAAQFGVSPAQISEIVHRKAYLHLLNRHSDVLPPAIIDQRKNLNNYK